jgi:HlyD family secretion protein
MLATPTPSEGEINSFSQETLSLLLASLQPAGLNSTVDWGPLDSLINKQTEILEKEILMRKHLWKSLIVLVVLAAAGGAGYWAYVHYSTPVVAAQESTLQTTTVQRGDMTITADGTGNLLPATELPVAFRTSGVLTELNVAVGDQVKAGDVLARLDNTDARVAVTNAEIQVRQAQINLALTQSEADAGLAQANLEAAQADRAEALASAAHTGDKLSSTRIALKQAQEALAEAQEAYNTAYDPARDWELQTRSADRLESERESAASSLVSAQDNLALAQANYNLAVIGVDDSAVQDADIQVLNAQVSLTNEQIQLEQLELALEQAQISLESAQLTLSQTVLTAPMDGTVTAINAQVGESVGTSTLLTLADLKAPLVRFWVEEADMGKASVGNTVNVVFDALPDDTFSGKIIRVEPVLVTVGSTSAVQVWASLDNTAQSTLLSGMTADVEVIAAEARDALLISVQALHELSDGQYAVFVVKDDESLEMRSVTVGLQDLVNAEILSGLEEGETVSLGTQDSSQQAQSSAFSQQQDGPPDGGMMMPPGGM